MNVLIRAVLALTTLTVLTACNTVAGIGKDVEMGGEAIQKAANK